MRSAMQWCLLLLHLFVGNVLPLVAANVTEDVMISNACRLEVNETLEAEFLESVIDRLDLTDHGKCI